MSELSKEDIRVKVSAFMDGELGDFEARRALKSMSADAELKRKWYRYQMASSAMRNELPEKMVDLSARIRSSIDVESRPRQSFLASTTGRFAIAACVAIFTVFGVQYVGPLVGLDTSTLRPLGQQQVAGVSGAVFEGNETQELNTDFPENHQFQLPRGFDIPQVKARTVSVGTTAPKTEAYYATGVAETVAEAQARRFQERAIRAYIEDRMLRHTERISLTSHQGMLPFARIPQNFNSSDNHQDHK